MEDIGTITPDSKPFTRDDWLDYIASDDCLVPGEPREVCNPANGQMVVIQPCRDYVRLIVNGEEIGSFSWSQNEEPLIVFWPKDGFENLARAYALKIAQCMGGQVED